MQLFYIQLVFFYKFQLNHSKILALLKEELVLFHQYNAQQVLYHIQVFYPTFQVLSNYQYRISNYRQAIRGMAHLMVPEHTCNHLALKLYTFLEKKSKTCRRVQNKMMKLQYQTRLFQMEFYEKLQRYQRLVLVPYPTQYIHLFGKLVSLSHSHHMNQHQVFFYFQYYLHNICDRIFPHLRKLNDAFNYFFIK